MATHYERLSQNLEKNLGWISVLFLLGIGLSEMVISIGMFAAPFKYFPQFYNMELDAVLHILNVRSGFITFLPFVGTFVADKYGRFRTILYSSLFMLAGMATLTITSGFPHLRPPKCLEDSYQCPGATSLQLGLLYSALGFLSISSGGIRACFIPFALDQFDPTTDEGKKAITKICKWFFFGVSALMLAGVFFITYVQKYVTWTLVFGIHTLFVFLSILLFFIRREKYVHVRSKGSIFGSIARVFIAAYKKRSYGLEGRADSEFHDPPLNGSYMFTKLPRTDHYRYLNKGAIITQDDLPMDGESTSTWRLISIQEAEAVKFLLSIIPIWVSGIVPLTGILQQVDLIVLQARTMDLHITTEFEISPIWIIGISLFVVCIWLPINDWVLAPFLKRITRYQEGIPILQRMRIGQICFIFAMLVGGFVEKVRRELALSHPDATLMSIFWLSPQLVLVGMFQAYYLVGQFELFTKEAPQQMTTTTNALFSSSIGVASYFYGVLMKIIDGVAENKHHPNWLFPDANKSRLDYCYFLLFIMGALNGVFFLYCTNRYQYKSCGWR